MPRCGSLVVNVITMAEAGFRMNGVSARKSGTPNVVVTIEFCTLGAITRPRVQGLFNRSSDCTERVEATSAFAGLAAIEAEPCWVTTAFAPRKAGASAA